MNLNSLHLKLEALLSPNWKQCEKKLIDVYKVDGWLFPCANNYMRVEKHNPVIHYFSYLHQAQKSMFFTIMEYL